jgi:hypothetical protein
MVAADAGAQVLPHVLRGGAVCILAGPWSVPHPQSQCTPPNCHTYMVAANVGAQVLPHVLRGGVVRILSCAWTSIAIGIKGVVLRLV